ncbi:hypothetical protein GCM10025858_19720 [Alicyclobacillus sacchari]|nr:hypothetical protein GCM10025858_19720 [Alicyclobacillus sacchari]
MADVQNLVDTLFVSGDSSHGVAHPLGYVGKRQCLLTTRPCSPSDIDKERIEYIDQRDESDP